MLNRRHKIERCLAVLAPEIRHFPLAHAMFARAGPLHRQSANDQPVAKGLGVSNLGRTVHIDQHTNVEISIADVANDRGNQSRFGYIALCLLNAIGKPRNRHADVGGQRSCARSQQIGRPIDIVTSLPKARTVLRPRRPFEGATAKLMRNFVKALRLFLNRCGATMKFQK